MAIDATAQQFTGGEPTILPFDEWKEVFKGIIGNSPAKFVCGDLSTVRDFAGRLFSPLNYWDTEGEELTPINPKNIKTAQKNLKKTEAKLKRIERKKKVKKFLHLD